MNSRQRLGREGEEAAARYLSVQGLRILERSFRCRFGELDLVAQEGDALVFVEVKTRSSLRYGSPQEAVTWSKRSHMIKAALAYLRARRVGDRPIRFDVVALAGGKVEHIRDAFRADGFTR